MASNSLDIPFSPVLLLLLLSSLPPLLLVHLWRCTWILTWSSGNECQPSQSAQPPARHATPHTQPLNIKPKTAQTARLYTPNLYTRGNSQFMELRGKGSAASLFYVAALFRPLLISCIIRVARQAHSGQISHTTTFILYRVITW